MKSKTTMMAAQYRLHEWAGQVKDCKNRPAGTSVSDWCASHGITKADYYYRLRRVREACLESICGENLPQQIVRVRPEILRVDEKNSRDAQRGLAISIKEYSIHVTESSSMSLLEEVLKVVRHAQ